MIRNFLFLEWTTNDSNKKEKRRNDSVLIRDDENDKQCYKNIK